MPTIKLSLPNPLLTVLALIILAAPCVAADTPPEYQVKSTYLYNISKFTRLPDVRFSNGGKHYDLCIVGDNPFGRHLDTLRDRDVGGRDLRLHFLKYREFLGDCEVVFISRSEAGHLEELLETVAEYHALTVSDIDSFALRGGMIGLVSSENRVKFEINSHVAQHCDIEISAKLLELAAIVTSSRQGVGECSQ